MYNLGSIWNYPFDISRVYLSIAPRLSSGEAPSPRSQAELSRELMELLRPSQPVKTNYFHLFSSTSPTRKKMVEEALSKKAYKPLVYFCLKVEC